MSKKYNINYNLLIITIVLILTISGVLQIFINQHEYLLIYYIKYLIYLIASIILYYVAILSFRDQKKLEKIESKVRDEYPAILITAITILGSIASIYFIKNNIQDLTIIGISIFSEEYRNSVYKGSGLYTVLLINVLPLLLSYNMIFSEKINKYFIISLAILVLFIILFGLRIILAPIILSYLIRISNKKVPLIKIFYFVFVIIVLSVIIKAFLDQNSYTHRSVYEYILNPLTRLQLPYLINFEFGHGIEKIHCIFPFINQISECNSENIKYELVKYNYTIRENFINLSKYSGIAIPLPVYLYNMFGFIAIPILSIYLILIKIQLYYMNICRSRELRIVLVIVILKMSVALVEDYLTLNSIDVLIVIGLLLAIVSRLKKIIFNNFAQK